MTWKPFSLGPLIAIFLLGASSAFAQTLLPGVSQEQMDAALAELSELYGSPVVRVDQAKAICNEEQYVVECAKIGKKYGLYPKERARQVDAVLAQLKGNIVEKLKACDSVECLIEVASSIAKSISKSDPELARTLELTKQKVDEKREVVEAAKSLGVDLEECRTMDPDTAPVELLRACAKLAKNETIQKYMPAEDREKIEKTDRTIALKEALERGDLDCGNGTIEGCGTFCLKSSESARAEGVSAIPQVCRDIATRFFGDEGVAELERAYSTVQNHVEAVREYQRSERSNANSAGDRGTTTSRGIYCPRVDHTPCPAGEYRQEFRNEFGCFKVGECIPFNTKTQEESAEEGVVCPAMPSVNSCPTGEEKIVSFISPECGTYYSCKPKVEVRPSMKFPYTLGSGRVVVSFEEARMYCYESGSRGASARGDKAECERAFGISVPDMPAEKQCAEYGESWRPIDSSGNCFSDTMTEYVTPTGVLRSCSDSPVYGCRNYGGDRSTGGTGQKEQVWNSLGLRSWIRTDADASRVESLKQACANVSQQAMVWMPGAGDGTNKDFGMPDPEKCRKAASCPSSQYFNGSECSASGSWQSCSTSEYWNGNACIARDGGVVTGSCSSDLISLLGSGCHSRGNAWFNANRTMYVLPGTKTLKSCSTDYISGCGNSESTPYCSDGKDNDNDGKIDYPADPGCYGLDDWDEASISTTGGRNQVWNAYGLQSMIREDADPTRIASLKQTCADVKSSSGNIWTAGAGTYSSSDFGMPDPAKCAKAALCTSGQYFDGASCTAVSSGGSNASMQAGCVSAGGTWDSTVNNCRMPDSSTYSSANAQTGCTSAGGTWDSATNYCRMPAGSNSGSCGSGYYWNGSTCVQTYSGSNSGSCGSGYYWNGSMCAQSSSGSGTGGSSGSDYSSMQAGCTSAGGTWNSSSNYCQMPNSGTYNNSSAQQGCSSAGGTWDSSANYCRMPSSSGSASSSGSWTSCGSNMYWDSRTSSCQSMQSACTEAHGTWDSTANMCRMPTSLANPETYAFACPKGDTWNGSYCTRTERSSLENMMANVFTAFAAFFGY